MATWEVVKFYWQTMLGSTGSTLTATSTLAGTAVGNIYNMLEGDRWEATDTTSPQYLTYDAGAHYVNNGDVETGDTTGWTLQLSLGGAATLTASATSPHSGSYSLRVDITNGGTGGVSAENVFLFTAVADLATVNIGEDYVIRFWAKADAAKTIEVVLKEGQSPFASVGPTTTLDLTTSWQFFLISFTALKNTRHLRTPQFKVGGNTIGCNFDDIEFLEPADITTADYIASIGHNFFTAGAELSLEASNDNFTTVEVMDAYIPTADTVELRELTYLQNEGFEVWDGGLPAGWSKNIGTETIAQENSIIHSGISSVKVTNVASVQGGCLQLIKNKTNIGFWQGKTVSLGAWVYATVAGRVAVRLWDGVSGTNSAFHTGSGTWEFLTVTQTLDNAATFVMPHAPVILTGTAITAYADGAILKIASSVSSTDANEPFDAANQTPFRYWRRKIGGTLTVAPKAAISIWGLKTELDYARASFDPNAEDIKANVNISDTGYLLGIHRRFIERSMSLSFPDSDAAFYATVKAWWDGNGLNNFFVAWEHANNPDDVFLMRPDPKFSAPLTNGGLFRDITIKLKGRKE